MPKKKIIKDTIKDIKDYISKDFRSKDHVSKDTKDKITKTKIFKVKRTKDLKSQDQRSKAQIIKDKKAKELEAEDLYVSVSPHKSVMIPEVLSYLQPKPGGVYLDATFGSGGHTRAILEHEPNCRVIALDWDIDSLEKYAPALKEEFGDRFIFLWGNFGHMYRLFKRERITKIDGVLADFGTSQMQITARPGFSVYRDAALDMRMSPAHQRVSAAEALRNLSERELTDIFAILGEERYARKIAQAIVNDRDETPFETTFQLASLIERVVGAQTRGQERDSSRSQASTKSSKRRIHPATRVFQALRMYVNSELDNMNLFLKAVMEFLVPGARCVCISFHSLEDRTVKRFFRECEHQNQGKVLTKRIVTPSEEEIKLNTSSRSACMRVFERS